MPSQDCPLLAFPAARATLRQRLSSTRAARNRSPITTPVWAALTRADRCSASLTITSSVLRFATFDSPFVLRITSNRARASSGAPGVSRENCACQNVFMFAQSAFNEHPEKATGAPGPRASSRNVDHPDRPNGPPGRLRAGSLRKDRVGLLLWPFLGSGRVILPMARSIRRNRQVGRGRAASPSIFARAP